MGSRVYVRDLEVLQTLQVELSQFNYGTNKVLSEVARGIAAIMEYLQARTRYWTGELHKREAALRACQSDHNRDRNCGAEDAAVREAQEALEKLRKLSSRLEQVVGEYQPHSNRLKQLLDAKTTKAKGDLQHSVQKYQDYLMGARLASGGRTHKLASRHTPKIHYHHIYPKFRGNDKYTRFFENLGIDVDQWTVAVDEETHLKYIHGEAKWNEIWKVWIDEHEGEVTDEEVLKFGRHSLTFFGIEGLWEGDSNPNPSGYEVPESEIFMKPNQKGGHLNE